MKTKMCNINISINIKIFPNTFYYLFLRNKSVGRKRRPTRNAETKRYCGILALRGSH